MNPDIESWEQQDFDEALDPQTSNDKDTAAAALNHSLNRILRTFQAVLPKASLFEPTVLAALSNEDTLTQGEMLKAPNKEDFLKVSQVKLDASVEKQWLGV